MDDSRQYLPSLLMALFAAILPHVPVLPSWVIVWCALNWGYILFCVSRSRPLPGRPARIGLAVVGILSLLVTYHTRIDSSAYISLLAVMSAIKPFEVSTHRDRMVTLFLAYFIVIAGVLENDSLFMIFYMFASVLVTTAVLIRINDPGRGLRAHFRTGAVIMGQALPVMLVLFFLFPRLDGSLVGITRSDTGVSGFSGELSPGSVSGLVEDDRVAFRVEFDGDIPGFRDQYWRGITFVRFDGKAWHRQQRPASLGTPLDETGKRSGYRVILEPHRSRWLFLLDYPVSAPGDSTLHEDFTALSDAPIHRTRRYNAVSRLRGHTGSTPFPGSDFISLPGSGNPKSRDLAARFLELRPEPEQVAEAILDYFRSQDFIYTLQPQRAGSHPVDDFLFDSREGYCEHYASAFAFLMRAAGIPARVVGGYLGGEVNPYGNYLIVRQSHAHAWVEVWSPAQGWFRVDPTLAVAPGRADGGLEGALSPEEFSGLTQRYLRPFSSFISQVRFGLDAFSMQWEARFRSYSYEQQREILDRIGIGYTRRSGAVKLLGAGVVLVFLLFFGYLAFHLRSKAKKPDTVKKFYLVFLEKLARAGVSRDCGTGPLDFAKEAARRRPDLADSIREITDLYINLRYSADPGEDTFYRFRDSVKSFDPQRKSA